MVIKSIVVS